MKDILAKKMAPWVMALLMTFSISAGACVVETDDADVVEDDEADIETETEVEVEDEASP